MRKILQVVFVAFAFIAMAPIDAGCGCEKDKCAMIECLKPLIRRQEGRKRKEIVVYVDNSTSCPTPDGTRDCPYQTIQQALLDPRADIISVFPTATPYLTNGTPIVLKRNQALLSFGETLALKGKKGSASAMVKPVLSIDVSQIEMGEGSRISGFFIRGAGSSDGRTGVSSSGISRCIISGNDFQNIETAIDLQGIVPGGPRSSGVDIRLNTFSAITNGMIVGANSGAKVKVFRNTLTDVSHGVAEAGRDTLVLKSNTFTGSILGSPVAISILGARELTLIGNNVSNYGTGLTAIPLSLGERLVATENNFSEMAIGNQVINYKSINFSGNTFVCDGSTTNQSCPVFRSGKGRRSVCSSIHLRAVRNKDWL